MSLPFLPPGFLDDWQSWVHVEPVLRRGRIVAARAEDVYPGLLDVRLTILDGPYGQDKADWDRVKDLPAYYAPHIEAISRCSAASASVYFWNTAAGWARVHPLWLAAGWTFRSLIAWNKGMGYLAGRIDTKSLRTFANTTEFCGFYQREAIRGTPISDEESNPIRAYLCKEQARSRLTLKRLKDEMILEGAAGEMIVRHSFYESQWWFPTLDQWVALHRVWNKHGDTAGRPYLQVMEPQRVWNTLDAPDYEALRADYEALRVPFTHPMGVSDTWNEPMVQGPERLKRADGKPLHVAQKPLLFAERMIRASSRPGELVFEPFGGTCRAAVACELLPAAEARRYVCVEPNEDYIVGAMADIERRRAAA